MGWAISNLLLNKWHKKEPKLSKAAFWLGILNDFGDMSKFLVDEKFADLIPETYDELVKFKNELQKEPVSTLKPHRGSAWVLVVYLGSLEALPDPFFKAGFLLPLEWRKAEDGVFLSHSPLLPPGLRTLADKIKEQFAREGLDVNDYYLYPDHIFSDRIDFNLDNDSASFESGWGALATGLYDLVSSGRSHFVEWPFSSIAYDFAKGEMKSVEAIEKKLLIARRFGADEIAFAPCQYKEIVWSLNELGLKKELSVYNWKGSMVFLKDIAALSDVNQHGKGNRLLRRVAKFTGVIIAVLSVACGYFIYDASQTVVARYADVVDSYGLPEGIFPLLEAECAARYCHWRFEYRGFGFGKSRHADSAPWSIFKALGFYRILRRVALVNSKGNPYIWVSAGLNPMQQDMLAPVQEFEYEGKWPNVGERLSKIYVRSSFMGGVEARKDLKSSAAEGINGRIQDFSDPSSIDMRPIEHDVIGSNGYSRKDRSTSIAQRTVIRDVHGRPHKVLFKDTLGESVADRDGHYGYVTVIDDEGRLLEVRYLNENLEQFARLDNAFVAGKRFYYEAANRVKEEYINAEGRPIKGETGWAIKVRKFCKYGNVTNSVFADSHGCVCTNRNGIAEYRFEYDSLGNRIKNEFVNEKGFPACYRPYCFTGWLSTYDCDGQEISRRYFAGTEDNPAKGPEGAVGWRRIIVNSNPIRYEFFNEVNLLALNKDGVAGWNSHYDEYGNQTNRVCFGIDGETPIPHRGTGFAMACFECEPRVGGRFLSSRYFNYNGSWFRSLCTEGYSGCRYEYADDRQTITFLDVNDNPTTNRFGRIRESYTYASNGQRKRVGYTRETRAERKAESRVSFIWHTYDTEDNEIKCEYMDAQRHSVTNAEGVAGWVVEYDKREKVWNKRFIDVSGKYCTRFDGVDKVRLPNIQEIGQHEDGLTRREHNLSIREKHLAAMLLASGIDGGNHSKKEEYELFRDIASHENDKDLGEEERECVGGALFVLGTYCTEGVSGLVQKDHAQAFDFYRRAAKFNNPVAQYNVGMCYQRGDGVAKDCNEALKWYRKALENGYENARRAIETLEAQRRKNGELSQDYIIYTIQRGDMAGTIARKYNVRISEIIKLNPGFSSNRMRVGQKIKIPKAQANCD